MWAGPGLLVRDGTATNRRCQWTGTGVEVEPVGQLNRAWFAW